MKVKNAKHLRKIGNCCQLNMTRTKHENRIESAINATGYKVIAKNNGNCNKEYNVSLLFWKAGMTKPIKCASKVYQLVLRE